MAHWRLAAAGVGGAAESAWRTFSLSSRHLRTGRNLLAVEVHQHSATSSDISFDLELETGLAATELVRGPYLQNGTPTGATVRWRTDQPSATRLWLGSSATTLQQAYFSAQLTTEHTATVTGLQPETSYRYAVGDGNGMLTTPGADFTLTTLPPAGAVRPLSIWAVGDSGFGNREQLEVRDQYLAAAALTRPADMMLLLGDNAYLYGTDAEYQNGMFDAYGGILRDTFSWSTFGNHDAASANSVRQDGVYFGIFTLPKTGEAGGLPSGTEAYYSFDRGHVHFICLDSMHSNRTAAGAMMTWLTADLAATSARWIIAYWHHPPYTFGSHDSDSPTDSGGRMIDMRQVALPILEAGGVDLVLGGHSHCYERSYLVDGHYGLSATLQPSMILDRGDGSAQGDGTYAKPSIGPAAHEGAVYIVAGNASIATGGALNHPVMCRSLDRLGSLVIDVDGDRLDATFLGYGGVEDSFTLLKGVQRTLFRDQTGISVATGGRQDFRLAAGSQHAGKQYFLAGAQATTPGITLGNAHVPLNADLWLAMSVQLANTSHYPNSFGQLDANGEATSALVLGPVNDPSLIGTAVHHAFIVLGNNLGVDHVSNTVKLTFLP
ncbi:MAG: metallophosphoesterase family protein [Planctomycetes bacterium]|nr:metallophosphoesterase family protein [Planctomycetota bacterium]